MALVTDGRMSGASGKVPAAIHVSPECLPAGRWRVRSGDLIRLDAEAGCWKPKWMRHSGMRVCSNTDDGKKPSWRRAQLFDGARAHATPPRRKR